MNKKRAASHAETTAFLAWMKEPAQLRALAILAIVFAAIGIAIPLLYPYPFTFPDSGAYVLTAKEGVYNVYRPMGYSSYLALLHAIVPTTGFLFGVTWTLWAIVSLWLLFSVRFLFDMGRGWIFWPMAACAVLMPRMMFSANFLMSDALFTLLATAFIASALWLVFRPNWIMAVVHLVLFWLLLKVRYSGMFFLPISMAVLFIGQMRRKGAIKYLYALLPALLFAVFYFSTRAEYIRQTGVKTFSAFSGWQLINNATVLFPEAKQIDARLFEGRENQALHRFLQSAPDSLYQADRALATDYMWDQDSPYKIFLLYYLQANRCPYTDGWVRTGKIYGDYASQLIRKQPLRYFTRFVLPSFASMLQPQRIYEEGRVFRNEPLYAEYYGLEAETYENRHTFFRSIYPIHRVLNVVYWVALAAALLFFCIRIRRSSFSDLRWLGAATLLLFIVIYLVTSALASPATTWRYTMPIFLPSLVFIFYELQQAAPLLCKKKTA